MERFEYRGCLVRYQFTGAGWFAHWRALAPHDDEREGHVTATPEEGARTVLELTLKAIDAAVERGEMILALGTRCVSIQRH